MNKYNSKWLKLCLGFVIALVLLESLLQVASLLKRSAFKAPIAAKNDESLTRIIAIGESTTAPDPSGAKNSWPEQLQELFDQNKDNVRVYNLAIPATSSNLILARLPEELKLYRPHMVISMMGINDSNLWLTQKEQHFYNHLMLYKVASWIHSSLFKEKSQSNHSKAKTLSLPAKDFSNQPQLSALIGLWKNPKLHKKAQEEMNKVTKELKEIEKAQFYTFLATTLLPGPQEKAEQFIPSYLLYTLSLQNAYWIESTIENLSYTLAILHKDQECLELASKFLNSGGELNDFILTMFSFCSTQSSNQTAWKKIFEHLPYQFELTIHQKKFDTTKKNYRQLHKLLTAQKIKMIAMQYPLTEVRNLKFYFQDRPDYRIVYPPYDDISFVGNEENFRYALKDKKYEELFVDKFAIHFGHATLLGNKLIAESAYRAIKDILNEKK